MYDKSLSFLKKLLEYMQGDPFIFLSSLYPKTPADPISVYGHQASLLLQVMPRRPIRILIADEVGLGKTIEAIAILRYLERRGEIKRTLILVPRVLLEQWRSELQRMGVPNNRIYTLEGKDIKSLSLDENLPEGYYLCSIDLAKRREHLSKLSNYKWDVLVADEIHNARKKTKRGEAVKTLAERSEHIILLSATPHRGDTKGYLWRLSILDPYINIEKADDPNFYSKTHDVLLFRRTKDVVNKVEGKEIFRKCEFITALVEPTKEEREFMSKLVSFLKEILERDSQNRANQLLAVILRKRAGSSPKAALKTFENILNNLRERQRKITFGSIKLTEEEIDSVAGTDYSEVEIEEGQDLDDVVRDIVEKCSEVLLPEDEDKIRSLMELSNKVLNIDTKLKTVIDIVKTHTNYGEKVIIFTEYKDTLKYISPMIEKSIGDGTVLTLSGENKKDFDKIKNRFLRDPTCKVLIATDVAAEGLNLQIANILINYEPPWSPIKIEQRIGRVWRLGQKKDVIVYNVVLAAEGDKEVVEHLYRKIMNVAEALDEAKPILGEKAILYKATATAEKSLWKVNPEANELQIDGKSTKISEYHLILESLKGNLSKFTEALLRTIVHLNAELKNKDVYPIVKAENIRKLLTTTCKSSKIEPYTEALRTLAESIAKKLRREPPREYQRRNPAVLMEYLSGILKDVPPYDEEKDENLVIISFSPIADGEKFIAILKSDYWNIPVAYDPNKGKILLGAEFIKYISDVYAGNIIIPDDHNEKFNINYLAKLRIKKIVDDFQKELLSRKENYRKLCDLEYRQKCEDIYNVGKDAHLQIIGKIIHVKIDTSPLESHTFTSTREKADVEEAAMEYVMEYEKRNGRNPEDVSRREHYDIRSVSPDGTVRYIEVKGHTGMKVFAELTEEEFRTAKELKESYWLYIVYNLERDAYGINKDKAKLSIFQNPIETMDYEVFDVKRYIFRPKNIS